MYKRYITRSRFWCKILGILLIVFLVINIFTYESKEIKESREMDIKTIYTKPNYTNLDLSRHVSKLISNFRCSRKHLTLLILITSNVSNFYRRKSIRMSWGKTPSTQVNYDFRTFFAVGKTKDNEVMKKVNDESAFYKDIIFGDFYEIFYNLPFKVEIGFEWAYKHCSFDYYLKTDDDVFINLPNLFELLHYAPKTKLYLGYRHFGARALRHGKYEVSLEEYSKEYLPEFCSGGGFIFSNDVVKNIIPYFRKEPFKLDDVYIAMLAMNAGVYPTHNKNFKVFEDSCLYKDNDISYHSTNFTRKRSCMYRLFYSMLDAGSDRRFIKTHYTDKL